MQRRRGHARGKAAVSATELAAMGFCEKRVLLAHLHGERLTTEQLRSVDRGRKAHDQYYREGLAAAAATSADRWCFVATCLFGDAAWQTEVLRMYRDEIMPRYRLGRHIVATYYMLAPGICRLLTWMPWLQPPTRALVGALARLARGSIEARGSS